LFASTLLGLLLCLPQTGGAIVRTWDDGAGGKNWISADNWGPNGLPQNVDDIAIGAHPNATDDTVIFGVFPPYISTVFSLGLSFGADLDLNNGRLVVIEDTTVGGGFGGGTPAELIVRPVEGMNVDALSTNTLTINTGGRLRMVGGSISVDGTAASEGVLEIAEGGSLFGYGVIDLDDDNVPDLVDMLLNDGTITVGDPETIVLGEPPARTLAISAPNDPNMGLMDLGGDEHDGQVVINRNSTLELNVRQINQSSAGDIRMFGNSTLDLGVSFGVGNAPIDDTANLYVDSGETDAFPILPAAPAVVTGNSFVLAPQGRISLAQPDAELRIESDFTAFNGTISNNGVIHFAGDARIYPEVAFTGNGELVNDFGSTLQLNNQVDADAHLVNEGELVIGRDVRLDSFSQMSTGTLGIQIADILPDAFDVLTVEGNAELGGTLLAELTDGFEPVLGNSFTVLRTIFGNISGEFEDTVLPEFNDLTFDVVYNPQSVVLEVVAAGLPGDYNDDGVVNAADYVVWRNQEGTDFELPNRDPELEGDVGADDYDFWVDHFGNTTGGGAASTLSNTVPEPGSLVLLLFGLATWACHCAERSTSR
jgi:hypothetical protein